MRGARNCKLKKDSELGVCHLEWLAREIFPMSGNLWSFKISRRKLLEMTGGEMPAQGEIEQNEGVKVVSGYESERFLTQFDPTRGYRCPLWIFRNDKPEGGQPHPLNLFSPRTFHLSTIL